MPICGPSGGSGGQAFDDQAQIPPISKVIELTIRAGAWVDAIEITHAPNAGGPLSLKHGGNGGVAKQLVMIPGEYITKIEGLADQYVEWLQITTSLSRHMEAGPNPRDRENFWYEAPSGHEIAGLIGRSGLYLDAIGVVLRALAP